MNRVCRLFGFALIISVCWSVMSMAVVELKNLPPEETKIADTVDPWGLAFGDQITRFQSHFVKTPDADFVVGYTHNLVKIWQNKYWFRGMTFCGKGDTAPTSLYAVTGSTASFQIAVLPKTGAGNADYKIEVTSSLSNRVYREEFVKTGPVAYPTFASDSWPDPLIVDNTCSLSGLNTGVFLVELPIPSDFAASSLACEVKVSSGSSSVSFSISINIVKLHIKPNAFPLVAWFNKGNLTDIQFEDMCQMVLGNHLQPLIQSFLYDLWKTGGEQNFAQYVQMLMDHGQTIFQVAQMDDDLYKFLKARNWLSKFMIYSNVDEPGDETFKTQNVPWTEETRKKYPGLRIYLASEYHQNMDKGCDIWLTDISSSQYDARTFKNPKNPDLWHYYCHLPVNFQMYAPLVKAPNMQIDNPALEQRLAMWISWYYGAKGVFIYMGNGEWKDPEAFWKSMDISDLNSAYAYPYGGIHHGNGFLAYPPTSSEGRVIPSLRMKILRDAIEDIAIFEAIKAKYGKSANKILNPNPEVFSHPHYFDALPETLLGKRDAILKWVVEHN